MATFLDVGPIIAIAWLAHACVGLLFTVPIVAKTRSKVMWHRVDCLALIIPFGVWFALAGFWGVVPKNMPNIVVEPVILSLSLPAAAAIRVLFRKRLTHATLLIGLLLLMSGVGVWIYFAIPTMAE